MEEMRAKRIKREYEVTVLRRREPAIEFLRAFKKSKLQEGKLIPESPDFCDLDIIKEILVQPVDVVVDARSFDVTLPMLPLALAQWREGLRRELLELVKSSHNRISRMGYDNDNELAPEPPLSEEECAQKLELASTVFTCTSCTHIPLAALYSLLDFNDEDLPLSNNLLFYPQVLGHRCLTRESLECWEYLNVNDYSRRLSNEAFVCRTSWSGERLSVDHLASRVAEKFVQMAGLDPLTATIHDMDRLDLRFSCVICIAYSGKLKPAVNESVIIPILNWRGAVRPSTIALHHTN